jgi:hypothetical protein
VASKYSRGKRRFWSPLRVRCSDFAFSDGLSNASKIVTFSVGVSTSQVRFFKKRLHEYDLCAQEIKFLGSASVSIRVEACDTHRVRFLFGQPDLIVIATPYHDFDKLTFS